ncbi:MAG: hypothetical protein Alpg2KO_05980 [Alphaproteobacteria bacterium]
MIEDVLDTMFNSPLFPVFAGLVGLVLGGLATVVADRWGRIADALEDDKEPPEIGIWYPPSHCDNCDRPLKTWEKQPIIGWLITRGQCPACGYQVSVVWVIGEALCGLGFAAAAVVWGASWPFLLAAVFIWFLVTMALSDWFYTVLPDDLTLSLMWLGLLAAAFGVSHLQPDEAIIAAAFGYLSLWILREVYYWMRRAVGFGGGDLKLAAALGAWIGPVQMGSMLMISFILAVIGYGILMLVKRQAPDLKKDAIPLGPALCVGGAVCYFAADQMHDLLLRLAGV